MRPQIVLIDDDPSFLRAMAVSLRHLGEVHCLSGSQSLFEVVKDADLVITDYKVSPMDGREIIRRLRVSSPGLPVILVTAFATKEVVIEAANMHAFAILEKPFDIGEMENVARRALDSADPRRPSVARTAADSGGGAVASPSLADSLNDGIHLCWESLTARLGETSVRLTDIEFRILALLRMNPGRRVPRDVFVHEIWGTKRISENALDTHLGNLKKKIPQLRERIQVIRGKGYLYG